MLRVWISLLAFSACLFGSALADETLDPIQPVPNDRRLIRYDAQFHQAFQDVFGLDVVARMAALPAFEPEYVVGIIQDPGGYHVLYLRADVNIWYAGSTRTTRCYADLDAPLAQAVIGAWTGAIRSVRARADVRMGLDGEMYKFAVGAGGPEFQAQTWSPDMGTTAELAVKLGDTLARDCWTKTKLRYLPVSWYYDRSVAAEAQMLSVRLAAMRKTPSRGN